MTDIAILYDSSCRCSTATACALEHHIHWAPVALCNLLSCIPEDIQPYHTLVMALPIHAFGTPETPWADAWPILEELSYHGKQVVLCGTGNEFCYDDDRLHALAQLSTQLQQLGAELLEGLTDMPMTLLNQWLTQQHPCRWQPQTRLIYSDGLSTRQQPLYDKELEALVERIRLRYQSSGTMPMARPHPNRLD
ncbi:MULTISPECIES: hypothetical protein [unclassified Oceanobacter]|jgi:flavodoxin|uniref:flavodoxin family protein n=1 Tax=unclassified Oceanobacter TaxID=2620260 RepID=UPI0026E2EF02|nr:MULTISPECIES: hypothetical protein [unclassified Oceanobacter]MDO6681282.1 hypothetical protein [Oceanobacter sp. 5_MG-2023]MDP2608028.1 hypothetical protein [Oceanobacter sp. 1_MG-2023]MDP2611310.1 hypothetical protein [Oceanobacter sp. 2_MG-2023]